MKHHGWALLLIAALLGACSTAAPNRSTLSVGTAPTASPAGAYPTAKPPILYPPHDASATYPVIRTWTEVLEFKPYAYLRPLPTARKTEIDGVYGKLDPSKPQWWRCARCADFMLAGGNWRLMLQEGTLRLYYEVTGFSTVSSYTVDGDRLTLFNDPHCPYETGLYTWRLTEGALDLAEVQDTCAVHLRVENLTHQSWISCQPPNVEAAATDHWIRPAGCG